MRPTSASTRFSSASPSTRGSRYDEDTTNAQNQALLDEASAIGIRAGQQLAWFDPELLAIPKRHWTPTWPTSRLRPYRHVVDDVVRNREHTRTPEIEELLAASGDLARTARDSFGALDNADLTYGQVRDDDGNLVELTKGRYLLLQESRNREVRKEAFDVFMAAYDRHKHVLSSLHAGSVRKDVFYAKARVVSLSPGDGAQCQRYRRAGLRHLDRRDPIAPRYRRSLPGAATEAAGRRSARALRHLGAALDPAGASTTPGRRRSISSATVWPRSATSMSRSCAMV